MPLDDGAIAFTGLDRTSQLDVNFAALTDIAAGTVINFTNNNWNGTTLGTSEGTWTWTATSTIAAGTIVTLDNLTPTNPYDPVAATSNLGTVTYSGGNYKQFSAEPLYAYVGDAATPDFIAAISIYPWSSYQSIQGTGLVDGVTAVNIGADATNPVIAEYVGPTSGLTTYADYMGALNNASNWVRQAGSSQAGNDGVTPDAPLPTAALTVDPDAQTITFALGSVSQQVNEGGAGTFTTVTFTVQRSGSTEGTVSFSGGLDFAAGSGITAADFGRALPGFSGTIAEGESSATFTIRIAGDIRNEANEAFQLVLTDVEGSVREAVIGGADRANVVITNDDPAQVVSFAPSSAGSQNIVEGSSGPTTITFTVMRTGSTTGRLDFTVSEQAGSSSLEPNDLIDVPYGFYYQGFIADGETSATFTIDVQGDTRFENGDGFTLEITAVANAEVGAVVATDFTRFSQVFIEDDDTAPTSIRAGEVVEGTIELTGDFTIAAGGRLATGSDTALDWSAQNSHITVDNYGLISGTNSSLDTSGTGSLVVNNHFGATMEGTLNPRGVQVGSSITINNAGTIGTGASRGLQLSETGGPVIVNNRATGIITNNNAGSDVIKDGRNVVINNAGHIASAADVQDEFGSTYGGDAIDIGSGRGSVINNIGHGIVEGSRHAITAKRDLLVRNGEGAELIGRNGSGINVDNDDSPDQTVRVINHGTITGASQEYDDSDGDAIDADGLLHLVNFGVVQGVGHSGYHNGGPNISQGIAVGGGLILNKAGALIYGFGNAIQVDDSESGPAYAAVRIVNDGTIQGDGHAPTAVTPEDAAAVDFTGREAINIVGDYNDLVQNRGTILGGVGLGGGNDRFYAKAGSTVSGPIDGGTGTDTLVLHGTGAGELGTVTGFEAIRINSGDWTLTSETAATVTLGNAAGVLSLAEPVLTDGAFHGLIVGLKEGSQIDLHGVGLATEVSWHALNGARGELTVTTAEGDFMLTLRSTGLPADAEFAIADDGAGGTLLTVHSAADPWP